MDIAVQKAAALKSKPADETSLGFGKIFSDHMFIMEYEKGKGWFNQKIQPYENLSVDPASAVFHYGQEIFEGLKAYRSENDDILLFRPRENALRLNQSAERMCMPSVDPDSTVEAIKAIAHIDRGWVPRRAGTSLYLRPTMIASDVGLGTHPSGKYIFFIICSPSGAYYPRGLAPIRIYVEDKYVRAAKGGTGFAKTGGNYAASLKAAEIASTKGCEQVLWLDSVERKYVEEVGSMNMMFIIDGRLCTAPLEGTILPGITRDSILTLARELGLPVDERKISVDEIFQTAKSGVMQEAFGAGTAAVVSPVGELLYRDERVVVGNGEIGPWAKKLYDLLTDIQWGRVKDTHGWITKV
jgi:branched-chain amino acid aminotransferase